MTDQLKEIGERLAGLRDTQDFSRQDMADKLKISLSDYVAYENGEHDFSFSFLYNAANILGVDILDLMSGESPKLSMYSIVRAGEGLDITRRSAYDYKHLAHTFRGKKSEPFLVTVTPKDEDPTLHSHDGQEFNHMLSGEMLFYIGDEIHTLKQGDSIYFDASFAHAMRAQSGDAKFLAVVMK